jgi:hypothetical protein
MNRKQFTEFNVMDRLKEKAGEARQVGCSSVQQLLVHEQVTTMEHEPHSSNLAYCFVCFPK